MRLAAVTLTILLIPLAASDHMNAIGVYRGRDCSIVQGLTAVDAEAARPHVPEAFALVEAGGQAFLAASDVACIFFEGRARYTDVGFLIASPDDTEGTHAYWLERWLAPGSPTGGHTSIGPIRVADTTLFDEDEEVLPGVRAFLHTIADESTASSMHVYLLSSSPVAAPPIEMANMTWWRDDPQFGRTNAVETFLERTKLAEGLAQIELHHDGAPAVEPLYAGVGQRMDGRIEGITHVDW